MTPEQAQDPEFLAHLQQKYRETLEFLEPLDPELQAEVYREALIALAGGLANLSGEHAEAQYKSLFVGAIKTGREQAGLSEEEK